MTDQWPQRSDLRAAVVIPVHGDAAPLARLLESIEALDWPRERLQVLCAVDGPDLVLEELIASHGLTPVVLATNRGSYAARNSAVDQIEPDVELVAFTDSDCILARAWLKEHAVMLARSDMSGGAIDVTVRKRGSAAEYVDRMRHLHQERYVTVDSYAATANLAVRRSVLDSLRFDEQLRSSGDDDFGTRARAAGFTLAYNRAAVVEHPARRTHADVMKKMRRICQGIESKPDKWKDRPVPRAPFRFHLVLQAFLEGFSRNPLTLVHICLLQYRADRAVQKAVLRARRSQGW